MIILTPFRYLLQPKIHNHSVLKKQNRVDIFDWNLGIKEVSLLLNLETEEISLLGTKLPCDLQKVECQPTPFTKATIVLETKTLVNSLNSLDSMHLWLIIKKAIGSKQMQTGKPFKNTIQ